MHARSVHACPRCGARELVDIVYGGPPESADALDRWARGDFILRPRREADDLSPGWGCRECGFERDDARGPGARRLRRRSWRCP